MADTVTWQTLRDLAGFRAAQGCALSLYVNLDPSVSPTPQGADTRFNSLVSQLEKTYLNGEDDGGRKRSIRADVERVQQFWANEFDRDGAEGLAVFASSGDDLFVTLSLMSPVRDHVHLDRDLSLSPLVPLVGGSEGALVAVLNRERGQVYRLRGGRLEEVVDETTDTPGQHQQGGWSQARYERHIDKLVQEHLKAVGDEIDKRVRRARGPQLVIVAPEELRPEIEGALATETKDAIVGWATAEAHANANELLEVVKPWLAEAVALREQEALERWREEMGKSARGVAGWAATLEAASDARVETLLLADGVADRTVYRCPNDDRAYADPGTCPLDGATLEEHDGLDLALHLTLAHGGTVVTVGGDLLGGEGIGALLRF